VRCGGRRIGSLNYSRWRESKNTAAGELLALDHERRDFMSDGVADAVKHLKFAAALMTVCEAEFRALRDSNPALAAEAALVRLHHVHAGLSDTAGRFCPDGQNAEVWMTRYDDGRPVISAMPMGGGCYAHAWHLTAGTR
jgi:hypothetical protein